MVLQADIFLDLRVERHSHQGSVVQADPHSLQAGRDKEQAIESEKRRKDEVAINRCTGPAVTGGCAGIASGLARTAPSGFHPHCGISGLQLRDTRISA